METQRKWLMNRSLSAPPPTPIHFCLVRRCVPRITVHLLAASLLQEATNRAVSNDRRQRGSWSGSKVLSGQAGKMILFPPHLEKPGALSIIALTLWGLGGAGHSRPYLTFHYSLSPGPAWRPWPTWDLLALSHSFLISKWEAFLWVRRHLVFRLWGAYKSRMFSTRGDKRTHGESP